MKKPILILIAVGIFVSMVTSGVWTGPIDQVFAGWRDTTGCDTGVWTCFFGKGSPSDYVRDEGVIVLVFLLVLSLLAFGTFKTIQWLKDR